jgi:hypothetical protein
MPRSYYPLSEMVTFYGDYVLTMYPRQKSPSDKGPGYRIIREAVHSHFGVDIGRYGARDLAEWARERRKPYVHKQTPPNDLGGPTPDNHVATITLDGDDDRLSVNARGQDLVQSVDDLIRIAGIDLNKWNVSRHRVNTWTSSQRGPDDDPVIIRHWQVRADLERRREVEAGLAISKTYNFAKPPIPSKGVISTLIIPDSQHGYRWVGKSRNEIEALHDERACDLAVQVATHMQPDCVVLLGDMLDLAEWSTRFPRPAELLGTTQHAIQRLHDWIAKIRLRCPDARIVYLEGNHEARVYKSMIEHGSPAETLTAIGDNHPVLSIPRLLALDSLGVEYYGPYGTDYWQGEVRFAHGDKVRSKGGATATSVIGEASSTTWYGHVHRMELAQRTVHGRNGQKLLTAASPGCLCRVDGSVPAATSRPDWQQGLGFMWQDGDTDYCEVRPIQNGKMIWDGRVLVGDLPKPE